MDRRILFPAVAITAWAQQPSQEAVEAEKALRARVNEFYQLQVDKKFRPAEAFVAEDTKDLYFASSKPDLQGFTIGNVELLDNNTKAKVTVKTKSTMVMMGVGKLPIEIPAVTNWKIEDGHWMWYVDVSQGVATPFGQIKPTGGAITTGGVPDISNIGKMTDMEAFRHQVTIDKTSVTLTQENPSATVAILNAMPGFIDVTVENKISGVKADLDTAHVAAGGKATLLITKTASGKVAGNIHVTAMPLGTEFDIRVQ